MNKVNINLFHGRNTVDEELEDWGFEGPILKDVGFAWTYGQLKIFNVNYDGSFGDMIFLPVVEGMVKLGGKYYGDFEILTSDDEAIVRDADRERLTFLQLKAIVEAETPEPELKPVFINGHIVDAKAPISMGDVIIRRSNNEITIANDEWDEDLHDDWIKIISEIPKDKYDALYKELFG